MQNDIDEINRQIAAINTSIAEHTTTINSHGTSIQTNATNITANTTKVNDASNKINSLFKEYEVPVNQSGNNNRSNIRGFYLEPEKLNGINNLFKVSIEFNGGNITDHNNAPCYLIVHQREVGNNNLFCKYIGSSKLTTINPSSGKMIDFAFDNLILDPEKITYFTFGKEESDGLKTDVTLANANGTVFAENIDQIRPARVIIKISNDHDGQVVFDLGNGVRTNQNLHIFLTSCILGGNDTINETPTEAIPFQEFINLDPTNYAVDGDYSAAKTNVVNAVKLNSNYYLQPSSVTYFGHLLNWVDNNQLDLRGVKWNTTENPVLNNVGTILVDKEIPSVIDKYSTAELHFYANKNTTVFWPDWSWYGTGAPPNFGQLTDNELYVTIKLFYNPADSSQVLAKCSYQLEDDDVHDFIRLLSQTEDNLKDEIKLTIGTAKYISDFSQIAELSRDLNPYNTQLVNYIDKFKNGFYLTPGYSYELGLLNSPYYIEPTNPNDPATLETINLSGLRFNETTASIEETYYYNSTTRELKTETIKPIDQTKKCVCEIGFTLLEGIKIIWPPNWIWDEEDYNIPGKDLSNNLLYNNHIIITVEFMPIVRTPTTILYPPKIHAKVKSLEKLSSVGKSVSSMKFSKMEGLITTTDLNVRGFYISNLDYLDIHRIDALEVATNYSDSASVPRVEVAIYKQSAPDFTNASTTYQYLRKGSFSE